MSAWVVRDRCLATVLFLALWLIKQKIWGQNYWERTAYFLLHCARHALFGYIKGKYELKTKGTISHRPAQFHMKLAVAKQVVQWGSKALWDEPRFYFTVQNTMSSVKRLLRPFGQCCIDWEKLSHMVICRDGI